MIGPNFMLVIRVIAYLISTFFIYQQIDNHEDIRTEFGILLLLLSAIVLAGIFLTLLKDDKSICHASE